MSQPFPTNRVWAFNDWKTCRIKVIAAFNKYHAKHAVDASAAGRKFFISFKRCTYAPKEIRRILEDRPLDTFSGGGRTNEIFRRLGFTVVKGTEKVALYQTPAAKGAKVEASLSEIDRLLTRLFRQRWADLKTELAKRRVSPFPGIYLLAYTSKPLAGTSVKMDDVFYVGMSTTALRLRLAQFWKGIHDGGHHSAARRFYLSWAGARISDLDTGNRFFVATLPVECEPRKGLRSSADLMKLGTVAALEYLALAKIKRELDLEPPLNKK